MLAPCEAIRSGDADGQLERELQQEGRGYNHQRRRQGLPAVGKGAAAQRCEVAPTQAERARPQPRGIDEEQREAARDH